MRHHVLKCWPESFAAIWNGVKTFEFRKNDRDYQVGDSLALCEFDPATNEETLQCQSMIVTYIVHGPSFGIPDGYCVMSIVPDDGKR